MAKRKNIYSIRKATMIAFERMDKKFHSLRLCMAVREIEGNPFIMDGTILRRLREIRQDNREQFNYKVIDSEDGLYQKSISATKNEPDRKMRRSVKDEVQKTLNLT